MNFEIHPRTKELLLTMGLSSRELQALDVPILHQLPDHEGGCGLIGSTGTGKTWAIVQAVAYDLNSHVMASADPTKVYRPRGYGVWLNWPHWAEELKSMVAQHFTQEIGELVERWTTCGFLILDDIGAERITGDSDYSLGVLRNVLDARYRMERVVYWTSNQNIQPLRSHYGTRLMSRMFEAWPPTVIKGDDLRLRGK